MNIKRIIFSVLTLFLISVIPLRADGLNSDQIKLRSDVLSFLKQEGFMPEIDSDGDIKFKREGNTMYVSINEKDESPMFITLSRYFSYSDDITQYKIEQASIELNLYKGVKVIAFKSNYAIRGEMYVRDAQSFCKVFYKLATQIDNVREDVREECGKISGSATLSGTAAFNNLPVINNVTLGVTNFNQLAAMGIKLDKTCDSAITNGIWYHTSGGKSNSEAIRSMVFYKSHGAVLPAFLTNTGISWYTSKQNLKTICQQNQLTESYKSNDTYYVRTPQGYRIKFSYDDDGVIKWVDFSMD